MKKCLLEVRRRALEQTINAQTPDGAAIPMVKIGTHNNEIKNERSKSCKNIK